ncbi:MAG: hypothetical protein LBT37_01950 [Lactobacillaceae bacterium]|jgi:hypothetical protein|nr:hypothetical protein [Lactobacillaceae bacterium]
MKIKMTLLYLLLIFLDSSVYSAFTTNLLNTGAANTKLLILAIEAAVAIYIYLDLTKLKLMSRLSLKKWSVLGLVAGLTAWVVPNDQIIVKLLIYMVITMSTSLITLDVSNRILEISKSIELGFMKMANLKTAATLFGFFLGAVIALNSLKMVTVISVSFFMIILLLIPKNEVLNEHSESIKIKALSEKKSFWILGLLSANTIIWIPLVASNFIHHADYSKYIYVPFVLPGIITLLVFKILKNHQINRVMIYLIFMLVALGLVAGYYLHNIPLQISMLCLMVPTSLLTSIYVRSSFLTKNSQINKKVLIQMLSVNSNIFLLIFALISLNFAHIESIIVLFNLVSVVILIRGEKNENRN